MWPSVEVQNSASVEMIRCITESNYARRQSTRSSYVLAPICHFLLINKIYIADTMMKQILALLAFVASASAFAPVSNVVGM